MITIAPQYPCSWSFGTIEHMQWALVLVIESVIKMVSKAEMKKLQIGSHKCATSEKLTACIKCDRLDVMMLITTYSSPT